MPLEFVLIGLGVVCEVVASVLFVRAVLRLARTVERIGGDPK